MRRAAFVAMTLGIVLISSVLCCAQDFKQYPGSKLDEKLSATASQAAPGMQSQVYTSADSFDKVSTFYRERYKEYVMPGTNRMPDSARQSAHPGPQVQHAFFILDDGKSLADSKYWMSVQYPLVGSSDGTDLKDIQNVTAIQTVQKK